MDRFWSKVEKTETCWLWRGQTSRDGYGKFKMPPNQSWLAHRFAYRLTHGDIPKGMFVCHTCDVPPCVNPDHLFLGTAADNSRDRDTKGRHYHVLTDEQVMEIRKRRAAGESGVALAAEFGCSQNNVSWIAMGKRWARLPVMR